MGHLIDYSFPKKVTQVPNIFTSCTINLGDREAILSILKANTKDKNIMEKTTKAVLDFTLFLMAFLIGAEGGRDVPKKDDQVYEPQTLWPFCLCPGFKGFPGFGFGFGSGSAGSGSGSGPGDGHVGGGIGDPPQAHTDFKEMAEGKDVYGDIPNAAHIGAGRISP